MTHRFHLYFEPTGSSYDLLLVKRRHPSTESAICVFFYQIMSDYGSCRIGSVNDVEERIFNASDPT
jgi:hypothetical protein